MGKRKRSNSNQSKYWLEDSEHFDGKSSDEDTNVNHDSEDAEIPSTLQDTSDESDDGMVERIQVINPMKIVLRPKVLLTRNHLDVEQNVNHKLNQHRLKYFLQNLVDNRHRKNLPREKFQLLISCDSELVLVDQQQTYKL